MMKIGRIVPSIFCNVYIYLFREGYMGLPRWLSAKESACQFRRWRRHGFNPWVRKIPWRRKWQPTQGFLPVKSHGQRSLAGYSSQGDEELDMTKQLNLHAQKEDYIFHDKIEKTFIKSQSSCVWAFGWNRLQYLGNEFDPQFHSVIRKKDNMLFEFTERERSSFFLWMQLLFCWN